MKLRKGWIVETPYGEVFELASHSGIIRWAKRHNYPYRRTFILYS